MRLELAGTGIQVSLIEPGPVESRFRANAYRAFQQHIVINNSVHHERYQKMIQRFKTSGKVQPFTLPPKAVPKRVMSDRMLDQILGRAG